ncbi:hypothetical protein HYPSUDRAFT_63566 [Hypholoma sublateritium FD-334 SS-4]|uniref:Fungal-type protein kinase domain-containing protein n=1 Tax=Hypholoma sublateritium (strain FD-334 SS-4) TaxID=945553 RepID=A0A0D2MS27_HYPSF|nr:hypothetical protein HYPSUDRAFT_63566 [Hypholoma sublateritium FD-334 SS-4]
MAQFIRSAKSGSDWTDAELLAYNVSITSTSPAVFFQSDADPSLDHLDPAILTSPNAEDPNLSAATADYLGYLDLASHATQESAIDDFAAATLRFLGFNERHTTVATRYIIPLTICGETRTAQTDVCLIYRPTTILLVLVEDKTLFNKTNVEAPVVAEAIAAFQFNNTKRAARGQPILEAMTIPCITMFGTTPTFYLVPVTRELSDAVKTAQYPTSQTQVLKCVTVVTHQRRLSDGMADTEFRKLALARFVAFKTLAKSYWQQYLA